MPVSDRIRQAGARDGDDRFFFFNDTATPEIYTLSLHDALPVGKHTNHCATSDKLRCRSRHSFDPRTRKHKARSPEFKRRVPVTASNAWPTSIVEMEREVDNQVAAPAETRTPNLHRARKRSSRVRMEGWRQ